MILLVDNYDSFTYNLAQGLASLGAEVEVTRNDRIDVGAVIERPPAAIVLSPGPGRPEDAGCCVELIRRTGVRVPILGVCLGHQAIAYAFGGRVVSAPEVVHGKTAAVRHRGSGLFDGLPNPFVAARYHSLVVSREQLPDVLVITAEGPGDLIMGMRHRTAPLFGVQFHPESIATPDGQALLRNFLRITADHAAGQTFVAAPGSAARRGGPPDRACDEAAEVTGR